MKRMLHQLSFVVGLVMLPCMMFGQRTITGTVLDAESGLSLIGANVIVSGMDGVGTSTDIDGKFTLQVPEGATSIEFSYTGYATQDITIGASNVIDVTMKVGSVLNEVVVIGYGEVKREDATGSVTAVGEESFNKGAITSAQELLAGKVAGVQITTNGAPGSGAQIRIRGGSSLSASNDPLIVIDGVPIFNEGGSGTRNIFNFVNPNDIETFTVLKDASSTAIYGSRASNGVILITTKKGTSGKITATYTGNLSISNVAKTVDMLTAAEYRAFMDERYPVGDSERDDVIPLLGDESTDWQNEIYRSATGTDHNISFSGGVPGLPYRASVGYNNTDGILKNDNFERTTASLNLTPKFLDGYLQVNASVRGMREKNKFGNRGAIFSALVFDPTQPIRDDNTQFGGYTTWTQPVVDPITNDTIGVNRNTLAPNNPIALLEQAKDESTVNRIVASTTLDYRMHFLPDLRANLNLAFDRTMAEGNSYADSTSFAYEPTYGGGYDNIYSQESRNELLEFYLNYNKEIGGSKFDVMGGYSWQRYFQEDSFFNTNIAHTPENTKQDTTAQEYFLLSLFGRFNYTLNDRYLFTFTLRQDQSSRFAKDYRKGLFPAAAFAWKIVDGDGKGKVSNLKLRLGYGVTGQQDVGGFYPAIPSYLGSNPDAYYLGGQTIRPSGYNATLKWEETTTYNAAIDYGFLNDKFTGSIEYYRRNTKDLLNFITTAAGSNFTDRLDFNIGDLKNEGVEFSLYTTPVDRNGFKWELGFNATHNQNEITKLSAVLDTSYIGVQVGGIAGGVGNNIQIHSIGYPTSSYYVAQQLYNEDGAPIEGMYLDRNGDGIVNQDDYYRLHQPAPEYYFGLTSNMSYKNFDFSFAARANVGNYNYNNIEAVAGAASQVFNTGYTSNVHSSVNKYGFENQQFFSDLYIQNASFLRFDHITVGYDFAPMIDNIDWLKFYMTVQNPIVITKYDGLDPEIAGGIDVNVYPRSRRILFGLNARF